MMKKTCLLMLLSAAVCCTALQARDKQRINMGWKFVRADVAGAEAPLFDDSRWPTVNLPHDAAVYGSFAKSGEGASARNGFRTLGRGWYRRRFEIKDGTLYAGGRGMAVDGKRVVLEFEGVYRDAKVYVNGTKMAGDYPNGYMDFEIDITGFLKQGDNVIAVAYDNTYEKSSRWYNGEGINRDVWLHVLSPLHVDRYGTRITTPKITQGSAKVVVETSVRNDGADSVLCRLVTDIIDPSGRVVASRTAVAPFGAAETFRFEQELTVAQPQLWNVGDGRMYKAVSTVTALNPAALTGGSLPASAALDDSRAAIADRYESGFGIREIEFSPEQGLLVNGQRVYVNGVCLHTDLGPLGTASLDAAWDRRLKALTADLGCNAIRLSHNCYPRYVLDWADRNGILVYNEFFDKWEDSFYGRGAKMGELQKRDIATQMRRDRNHPSVFIWSVGNETYQQIDRKKTLGGGVDMLKMLVDMVRRLDPSRKVTVGQYPNRYGSLTKKRNPKAFDAAEPHQFQFYTDVVSTNYLEQFWDRDHKKYPQLVFIASEMAVGELGYDFFNFDHSYPVGQFYWGGTDYIGESFGWPAKGWVRGLIDFTNRLKPVGQSVRSFYTSKPMVSLAVIPGKESEGSLVWNDLKMEWNTMEQKWNYADGQQLKVQVMSNCDETELFINGESCGKKQLPPKDKAPELTWMVNYRSGELRAVGYRDGVKIAEDVLKTDGKPARIVVDADVQRLRADGLDLAYLNYTVVDKNGVPCTEPVRLEFTVTGQGVNAGVASADMLSDEPWQATYRTTAGGRAQLIVRAADKAGKVKITAKAKALKSVTVEIPVE
jgi:beta-galactosidase